MKIWGYTELDSVLRTNPAIKNGVLIDTNILVAATYDLDEYHEDASKFIDSLIDHNIPIFCNINIRSEYLEIHRRILFSEAILDFERECEKAKLPFELVKELNSFRRKYDNKRTSKPTETPLKLSESEIKAFKVMMIKVSGPSGDLWAELCINRIGTKLDNLWDKAKDDLGLNTIGTRKEDQDLHLNKKPEWEEAMQLIASQGLSSSDAMIMNLFLASKFEAIASSDKDILITTSRLANNNKICFVPDDLKNEMINEGIISSS